jgi:hypothetical protein
VRRRDKRSAFLFGDVEGSTNGRLLPKRVTVATLEARVA